MNNIVLIIFCLLVFSAFYFIYFLYLHNKAIKKYENLIFNTKGEFINIKSSVETIKLPILTSEIEGKTYNFLVDSGANVNIISKEAIDMIQDKIILEKTEKIITIEAKSKEDRNVCSISFSVKGNIFSDKFIISDRFVSLDSIERNYGIKIDGILGSNFLYENKWIIDYNNLVVWIGKKNNS